MEQHPGPAVCPEEDDSKESTNNTLLSKSKFDYDARSSYHSLKSTGEEAQMTTISSLHIQGEDLDLIETTELSLYKVLNEAPGNTPLSSAFYLTSSKITGTSQPDYYPKRAVENKNLEEGILEHDLPSNVLQKNHYPESKIHYVISEASPPPPIPLSSPLVPKTSETDTCLKRQFKIESVDELTLTRMLKDLIKFDDLEVLTKKEHLNTQPNDNDIQVPPSLTISSINCNSSVPELLYAQNLLVVKENIYRTPHGCNDDEDDAQPSTQNSGTAVMMPESLSATPPSLKLTMFNQYECRYCFILFSDELIYLLHMHAHSDEEPFTCVCGTSCHSDRLQFNSHNIYRQHQLPVRFQTQLSPAVVHPLIYPINPYLLVDCRRTEHFFECIQCKIKYRLFTLFSLHMIFHSAIRTFTCNVHQNMTFSDSYSFNAHLFSDSHIILPYVPYVGLRMFF